MELMDLAESKNDSLIASAARDSKDSKIDAVDENIFAKRNMKWLSFAKPKTISGFDHVAPTDLPSMGSKPRGISLVLDKIVGWVFPLSQFKQTNFEMDEFTVQLSFSMYHFKSKTFFGSTWLGSPISLSERDGSMPVVIDVDYKEILYLISRITDSGCVGVTEIVVSRVDKKKNLILQQYGCGWAILRLFETGCHDLSDGADDVPTRSSVVQSGSPRDLITFPDLTALMSSYKPIPNCKIEYKLFSHRQLLAAKHLIAENEVVGRFDVIPGLVPKPVVLTGATTSTLLPCLGDEEIVNAPHGVMVIPARPVIAQHYILQLSNCLIACAGRHEAERRMAVHVAKGLGKDNDWDSVQISSRTLKIGLHNGHTLVGNDWLSINLVEDRNDENMLLPTQGIIDIDDFVPSDLTALVVVLEYEFRSARNDLNTDLFHTQSIPLLQSSFDNGRITTTVTVGAATFVPFDGSRLVLHNHPMLGTEGENIDDMSGDELAVQLSLMSDDTCALVATKPIYVDIDARLSGIFAQSMRKASPPRFAQHKAESKDYGSDNEDITMIRRRSGSVSAASMNVGGMRSSEVTPFTIAFDIKVLDPIHGGELLHGETVELTAGSPGYRHVAVADDRIASMVDVRTIRKSHIRNVCADEDTHSVLTDPLVHGAGDWSSIKLDPQYYAERSRRHKTRSVSDSASDVSVESRFKLPMNKNSLLNRAAQLSLVGDKQRRSLLHDDDNDMLYESQHHGHTIIPTHRGEIHAASRPTVCREVSRATRARMARNGVNVSAFDPNSTDPFRYRTPLELSKEMLSAAVANRRHKERSRQEHPTNQHISALIESEVDAEKLLHEVTLQFVGFRTVFASSDGTNRRLKHVYFTFQFYTCQPTRTEVLRLHAADDNTEYCTLVREDGTSRDELPIALRYTIDCSGPTLADTKVSLLSDPLWDSREFASYLAQSTLFIDMWDADSLLQLGTCAVPLQKLMCQDKSFVNATLECDVISAVDLYKSDGSIVSAGHVPTTVLPRGAPAEGCVVGAVQLLLTHSKRPSPSQSCRLTRSQAASKGDSDRLNWRVTGTRNHERSQTGSQHRPRTRVHAVPLSEASPELSKVLADQHQYQHTRDDEPVEQPPRSLTTLRGTSGGHTLTYDELVLLFRRFQGSVKGTLQYAGPLMKLLDVPSWSSVSKKLLDLFDKLERRQTVNFEKELMQHADSQSGQISHEQLIECLSTLFHKLGITARPGELRMICQRFHTSLNHVRDICQFCRTETNRRQWEVAGRKLRVIAQKAAVMGANLEQLLARYDTDGDGYISKTCFREFLKESATRFGKLTLVDLHTLVKHFSRAHRKFDNYQSVDSEFAVSLEEVCSYMGLKYIGNIPSKIRQCLGNSPEDTTSLTSSEMSKKLIRLLIDHTRSSYLSSLILEDIEHVFSVIGVYSNLTHKDVRDSLKVHCMTKLSSSAHNLSARLVLQYLNLPVISASAEGEASYSLGYSNSEDDDKSISASRTRFKPRQDLTAKEILIRELHPVAAPDGGIKALLAFLDSDRDGCIELKSLVRQLRRENVFDCVDEYEAIKLLKRHCSVDDDDRLSVHQLLKFVSNDEEVACDDVEYAVDVDHEMRDDLVKSTAATTTVPEYEFSRDPEIHTLEKKLRSLGHFVAKKGVDVESLLKAHDPKDSGLIRRTDFIQVVSSLGLYILEKGKVMDAARGSVNGDSDLRQLQQQQVRRLKNDSDRWSHNSARLARQFVMGAGDADIIYTNSGLKDQMECMSLINWYRESQKKQLVQRMLSHSLSSTISLFPQFGKTLFFEYPVTNPFAHEEHFVIELDPGERELRLVTQFEEWQYLREHCRVCVLSLGEGPLERDMFDVDKNGGIHLSLLPHETLHLPFTFMSLDPNSTSTSNSQEGYHQSAKKLYRTSSVKVLSASHGHLISVLNVNVFPRPFVIDRTIRFHESENSICKRRIRAIGYDDGLNTNTKYPTEYATGGELSRPYVHCVEYQPHTSSTRGEAVSNVVIEWLHPNQTSSRTSSHRAIDFLIRYRTSSSSEDPVQFFLLLYDDPFQCHLREVWSIVVEPRPRLDLQGSVGSLSSVDFVVRGDTVPRRVKAFASDTGFRGVSSFSPDSAFQLIAGAYNSITLKHTLRTIGLTHTLVNVVDVDSRKLVGGWLVSTSASAPTPARVYHVSMLSHESLHKKIVFQNPWPVSRRFLLHSSDEQLMQTRDAFIDISANGGAYMRLIFNPYPGGINTVSLYSVETDVYLFLCDEEGRTEESFLFRVSFPQ